MSNYSTTYSVSQGGDLFGIQDNSNSPGTSRYGASKGTTVQSPLNYRKLIAFKYIDNEFFFFVKNQDRKVIKLHGMKIYAAFVNRDGKSRVFSKACEIVDPDTGACKLIVNPGDIDNQHPGNYDLVLTYTDGRGLTLPLYSDVNYRPNLIVEISEDAHAIPLTTVFLDTFILDNGINYHVSERTEGPHYYRKRSGLVTMAVYATGYVGQFYLQGSLQDFPDSLDWFNIELGAAIDYHGFVGFTGIEPFSVKSNAKWLRVLWQNTGTGTVDKVTFRL
tara:strand:- start:2357 stop:3184 length:828 start_codon:yes stop_codon:yes gene_type:complete